MELLGCSLDSRPGFLVVVDTRSGVADPGSSRRDTHCLLCRDLVMIELQSLGSQQSFLLTPSGRGVPHRFEFRDFAVLQLVCTQTKM
jgi:hypothetical protein